MSASQRVHRCHLSVLQGHHHAQVFPLQRQDAGRLKVHQLDHPALAAHAVGAPQVAMQHTSRVQAAHSLTQLLTLRRPQHALVQQRAPLVRQRQEQRPRVVELPGQQQPWRTCTLRALAAQVLIHAPLVVHCLGSAPEAWVKHLDSRRYPADGALQNLAVASGADHAASEAHTCKAVQRQLRVAVAGRRGKGALCVRGSVVGPAAVAATAASIHHHKLCACACRPRPRPGLALSAWCVRLVPLRRWLAPISFPRCSARRCLPRARVVALVG
mmetsp:Transcript_21035/g.53460  ORF Transcript_21035/g.53460 Transcript_21035/m.53460 type:complete len:271 (+) Transcript_21035:147-959(+)